MKNNKAKHNQRFDFKRWLWQHPVILSFIVLVFLSLTLNALFPLNLPESNKLFTRVVVDENERPLRVFADEKGIWRYPITTDDVSPLYLEALINYEDRWFWHHPGINPFSITRAAFQNITNNKIVSGGSTITMQVARLLHPHKRTLWGKLQQLFRTFQLEWQLDKKEILQLYLNIAPFGGTIEGVEAASYTYLNKPSKELTHAEAALLAVLPQAPTRYRPDLNSEKAQAARDKVLKRLAKFDIWSEDEINAAMLEKVYSFNYKPKAVAPLLSRRLISHSDGQAVVKSTINRDIQVSMQELANAYVKQMPVNSSAAILIVENRSMAVKAYIGTADFASNNRYGFVDMVLATRSPGSTLKPFIYGLALDEGLIHSHSLLADVPRSWGDYRPANFSGKFNGPVSAHDALQRSLNVPAVDLLERYGANKFVAKLHNAGLALKIPRRQPNLSIILGGAGTSLERLVASYTALANEGMTGDLKYQAKELDEPIRKKYLMSPEAAWIINHTLAGISRPKSINHYSLSDNRGVLAWKTGTSYGFRDSWAIGINSKYTIGVWLGRPDGSAVPGHYGRVTAGPLLFNIADYLGLEYSQLPKPEKVTQTDICWPTGTLAKELTSNLCHQTHKAWLINQAAPPTWHFADTDVWLGNIFSFWVNPESKLRVSMSCKGVKKQKAQIAVWPKVTEPWLSYNLRRSATIPSLDPNCRDSYVPASASLKITGIEAGSTFKKSGVNGRLPSLWLKTIGGSGQKHWFINGKHRYTTVGQQGIEHLLTKAGKHQVVVQDEEGNHDVISISVH